MDKLINLISESPFGESPVMPELLEGTTTIQFQCRKGIDCWNACCSNIDISLTPVDILRLSRRLDISTTEFLVQYTFPYELEPNGIAGVKFKPVEGGSACQFMRPEGCDVYSDRRRLPLLPGGTAVHAPLGRIHRPQRLCAGEGSTLPRPQ